MRVGNKKIVFWDKKIFIVELNGEQLKDWIDGNRYDYFLSYDAGLSENNIELNKLYEIVLWDEVVNNLLLVTISRIPDGAKEYYQMIKKKFQEKYKKEMTKNE